MPQWMPFLLSTVMQGSYLGLPCQTPAVVTSTRWQDELLVLCRTTLEKSPETSEDEFFIVPALECHQPDS